MEQEKINEVLLLLKNGVSNANVARLLNLHKSTVSRIRRENGLKYVHNLVDKKKVFVLKNEGFSDKEVCEQLNISESYFKTWKRLNLPPESKKPKKVIEISNFTKQVLYACMLSNFDFKQLKGNNNKSLIIRTLLSNIKLHNFKKNTIGNLMSKTEKICLTEQPCFITSTKSHPFFQNISYDFFFNITNPIALIVWKLDSNFSIGNMNPEEITKWLKTFNVEFYIENGRVVFSNEIDKLLEPYYNLL